MSEIKVNKISPRTNCGTVQLGDSGDTFTIPSGATINNQGTATNFGATGSASWVTTVKTSTFTAVAGEGYFINTTGGVVSVNLPAGTAGAVVAIKDYAGTFDTNPVTLVQNGSDKIGGSAVNASLTIEGLAVTLVFIDSTQGWLVTDSGLQSEAPGPQYVTASVSGCCNTQITDGDFKVAIFKGPGTFTVSDAGNASGSNTVEYLTVAGGGGGGASNGGGGGGGAGGYRQNYPSPTSAGLPVSVQAYPIAVSAGGAGGPGGSSGSRGTSAGVSTFSTITSAGGGGGGGTNNTPATPGLAGGSGGGGGRSPSSAGGAGNTPPVSPPQGNNGGTGGPCGQNTGGGGGGAGGVGANYSSGGNGGPGGVGSPIATAFFGPTSGCYGTPGPAAGRYFAGGGGSGGNNGPEPGGSGGGGNGIPAQTSGTINTGGGGGGGGTGTLGIGGSGIVVIRYKFK